MATARLDGFRLGAEPVATLRLHTVQAMAVPVHGTGGSPT